MQEPHSLLKQLGLSDAEVQVYLAMAQGARSATDIGKQAGQKRPTVYYSLKRLEERGLVSRNGNEASSYSLEPFERLEAMAEEKSRAFSELKNELSELSPIMFGGMAQDQKPHVSFFEGVPAVKSVIMDTLYCRGKHIDSIAPKDNFFQQLGRDFAGSYVEARVKRNITTRNLWDEAIDQDVYEELYRSHSQIKKLPEACLGKIATTIFLYDDKVLYISSKQNAYCLLVTSQEHHDTMSAIYEGLWMAATPVPKQP